MVDFKALSLSVFEEQNKVRLNPSYLIPHLEKTLQFFKGNVLYLPGSKCGLSTNEGPAAYKEAIEFLKKASPLSAFIWSDEIGRAASDHANDIGPKNIVGHSGSDGSSMQSRLERYGEWDITIGENIDFGGRTGKDVLSNLIVDDGVQSRGHRKNIFNPKFAVCGIGAQTHLSYGTCIVLDYAGGYRKKGDSSNINDNSNFVWKKNAENDFNEKANAFSNIEKKFENFNINESKPNKNDFREINRQVLIGSTGNKHVDDQFINNYLDKININKFESDDRMGKQFYGIKTTGNSNFNDSFNENVFGEKNLKGLNCIEDKEKPEGTIQTKVVRNITITNGKKVIIETKTFILKDGSTKIVETKIEE